jgi:hypothetical protein
MVYYRSPITMNAALAKNAEERVLNSDQLSFDQLPIKRAGLQQVVVRTGPGDPAVVEDDHAIDIDDR